MIRKNLEIFDPEQPPIYYYSTNSLKKPSFIDSPQCKRGYGRKLPRFSGKLMLIFAALYVVYLFYLAIEKPKFALDYATERNRKAFFSSQQMAISATFNRLPLQKNGTLQLTFQNRQTQPSQIVLWSANYHFGKEGVHSLPLAPSLSFDSMEQKSLPVSIPLPEIKEHKTPQIITITLTMGLKDNPKKDTRTISIPEF